MTLQQVLFIVLGAVTLGAALMVVTRRNVFRAVLFLILSFLGVAGLYVLLEAPFLAAVQFFIYTSFIAILIIFAIMLTNNVMTPDLPGANRQWWAAAAVTVALLGVVGWMIWSHDWAAATGAVSDDGLFLLGTTLVDPEGLLLPFGVASVLLLAAIIGAATLAREQ
jgi:NADH-quinone oxidoreductase subunit J